MDIEVESVLVVRVIVSFPGRETHLDAYLVTEQQANALLVN
jgi:hypothetical protein